MLHSLSPQTSSFVLLQVQAIAESLEPSERCQDHICRNLFDGSPESATSTNVGLMDSFSFFSSLMGIKIMKEEKFFWKDLVMIW